MAFFFNLSANGVDESPIGRSPVDESPIGRSPVDESVVFVMFARNVSFRLD